MHSDIAGGSDVGYPKSVLATDHCKSTASITTTTGVHAFNCIKIEATFPMYNIFERKKDRRSKVWTLVIALLT